MKKTHIIFVISSVALILGLGALNSCSPSSSSGSAAASTVTLTMKGAAN